MSGPSWEDARAAIAEAEAVAQKRREELVAMEQEYNTVLDILKYLDEEGDSFGKCVDKRCKRSPCLPTCHIRKALERAGRKP